MMIDDATLQNALDACPTPLYLFDHQVLNDRITRLRASALLLESDPLSFWLPAWLQEALWPGNWPVWTE